MRLHMARKELLTGRNALLLFIATTALCQAEAPAQEDGASHNYPTFARVAYVQECMVRQGGEYSGLYKCSCAVDRIAQELAYDEFVEMGTFARNAALAGERSGVFRDSEDAREAAKRYRAVEAAAYKACGIPDAK
jgi:hypothetical protein